jgi:fructose-1,6-bisphosphatase/inositol monophosphatase family enzyme
MALVASIALAARSTRALGTSAIALAWVAAGRIDAYVQDANLSLWDIAGPGVIAVEAGAVVEGLNGEPWLNLDAAKDSRIIASTPGIVAEVRSAIGR